MHAIKMKYAKTITFYITDSVLGPNDEVGGGCTRLSPVC
jgi:hypothetical protein